MLLIFQNQGSLLSLHWNGSNSLLLVNATNIYQFKRKDSEINPYILCLGDISKYFKVFSADYNAIDISDILDIQRYLTKQTWYEILFGFIKKMFIGLLSICAIVRFGALLASYYKEPIKCVTSKQSIMES